MHRCAEGVIRGILPLIVIRSGGMYAARSIFAEQSLPCGSKNAFLADLPPGSPGRGKRQIRRGKRGKGTESPSQ